MKRRMWFRRFVALAAVLTLGGFGLAAASSERSDCPGKIVCPITGKLVCKDRCPAPDTNRADCPGRIVCPLTGKLVCKDRCPLHKSSDGNAADKPSCCSKGERG